MNNAIFFGSAGDERGTPQDFFDKLDAEFHFTLDAAASTLNHKCELWFGEGGIAYDALEQDWGGEGSVVFLNPPYSVVGAFVKKAREEADKGAVIVMLLPVRSDTKWWQSYIWDKDARGCHEAMQVFEGLNIGTIPDGNWRPGVRCRLLPGRLNFELHVPADMRTTIKTELQKCFDIDAMVKKTGLPKMAIDGILADKPDDELLTSAPFPSCVVVFSKA